MSASGQLVALARNGPDEPLSQEENGSLERLTRQLRDKVHGSVSTEPVSVIAVAHNTPRPHSDIWDSATYLVLPAVIAQTDTQLRALVSTQRPVEIADSRNNALKKHGIVVDLAKQDNTWYSNPTMPSPQARTRSLDDNSISLIKDVSIKIEFSFSIFFSEAVGREIQKESLTIPFSRASVGGWAIANSSFIDDCPASAAWKAHGHAHLLIQECRDEIAGTIGRRCADVLQGAGEMTARLLHELQSSFCGVKLFRHTQVYNTGTVIRVQVV